MKNYLVVLLVVCLLTKSNCEYTFLQNIVKTVYEDSGLGETVNSARKYLEGHAEDVLNALNTGMKIRKMITNSTERRAFARDKVEEIVELTQE